MSLWINWWDAIWQLRPAFSRLRSFLWFATAVAGLTVRTDLLGVTSIVRGLALKPLLRPPPRSLPQHGGESRYARGAVDARGPEALPGSVAGERTLVLVGDGIKAAKRGRKMPAVKLLHQQSDSSSKPEYIMGHSLQALSILVPAADSCIRRATGHAHPRGTYLVQPR